VTDYKYAYGYSKTEKNKKTKTNKQTNKPDKTQHRKEKKIIAEIH